MNIGMLQWNLAIAWLWILLGFLSGALLGLGFHRENWLGGYASHQRRLYRLGHISFFGLALMNLMFYFTARDFPRGSLLAEIAGWTFIIGAVTMPLCCLIMAHQPKARLLFAIPVSSLLAAGALTFWEVVKL
jgi:predicted MFS family arabinose efflux permease